MSDETLPALYEELERIGAEAAQWAEVEASDSTAMVHVGSADPEKMRERMIEVRREAREKSKALADAAEKVREEIRREVDRQRDEMEARMRSAMAALAPLQQQVKRMEEGIWTVNLYLGTSEEVVTLRTGEPAPIETPIHLRTQVLAMDEEVASFPVEMGETDWQGMDYRDVEMFDRWVTENPAHLAQVLPEPKGVVVFQPRRTEKVYHEDPMVNAEMNEGNFESYWLIRNGENLYRLRTNFRAGGNLMPVTSEFTALFHRDVYNHETREWETREVLPGTREWADAEKAQDAKRRHYMRVALILQGLIDRTEMFQPLHAAVNVMQQSTYDDGLVVVIDDSENTLHTSREPYYEWLARLNAELRPGMRIIGSFKGGRAFKNHEYDESDRIYPSGAENPPSDTLLLIEGRKDYHGQKGFVVRYQRTVKVWDDNLWVPSPGRPGWGHRGGYKMPERRASAVILPGDRFVIPFDLVTEEEMQTYLDARTERHAYADSFPLLQAAIAAKREEREAEAPFRDLLTRVLADDNGQTLAEVLPHIDGLVHRFKLGNKWHRPLVSLSQEEEAKALRLIRAEYKRIVESGATAERDQHAVDTLRKHDPEVMFVGRLSSGKYVAFAPMRRGWDAPEATHTDLWVREHTTGKTARSIATREWITPGTRAGKMTTLFETERWTGWDRLSGPADDLTDAEMAEVRDRVVATARETLDDDAVLLAVEHDRRKHQWTVWAITEASVRAGYHHAAADKVTYLWRRDGDRVEVEEVRDRIEDFGMSYGGNHHLGEGRSAFTRTVYLPWQTGGRTSWDEKPKDEAKPKPTVIWEAAADVLAHAVHRVREEQDRRDRERERESHVAWLLRAVEDAQVQEKVESTRAKFLAEYPDEEMWEEKRNDLTKGLRAGVRVTDGHHFMTREPMGENSYSLHEREGYRALSETLHALAEKGLSPEGLTVRDVYRLAEESWPAEVYDAIGHIVIPSRPGSDDDS